MNKPNQTRYIVSIALGVLTFVIIGYFVYAARYGAEGAPSMSYWLRRAIYNGVYWWVLIGGAAGAAANYLISKR
ncbi:hypothetical protein D3C87_1536110 [compost metagenome]